MIMDDRGITTTGFLIYATVFIFLVFGSVDYWLTMKKIDQLDHGKEYYLDRSKLEGYLSIADENTLLSNLTAAKYTDIQIICTAKESAGDARILRNVDDLSASEISLRIINKPNPQPFLFGMAIGNGTPDEVYFDLEGSALVGRVDP